MTQSPVDNRRIAMDIMDAMAIGDPVVLSALLHKDVRWHIPPSVALVGLQPTLVGSAAVVQMIRGTHATFFKDVKFEYLHALQERDMVFLLGTLAGTTHSGPRYENDYAVLIRFADGVALEGWEFTDTAHSFKILQEARVRTMAV